MGEPDEGVERFEITQDDLDSEFNPFGRYHRKQSKEEAIYGMWARQEDSDDDAMPSGRSRRKKGKADYTMPVNFISGGVKAGTANDEEDNQSDGNEADDDEDTFQGTDSEEEYIRMTKAKPQQTASEQKSAVKDVKHKRAVSGRSKGHSGKKSQHFGVWEAHTKGIGQRLLEKMGYRHGQGLGKEGQGITAPVEAFVRKGRGAVGAYGAEKPATISSMPSYDDPAEEQEEEPQSQWRKSDDVKKPKYTYKTVEDLMNSGTRHKKKPSLSVLGDVKVIDMTGPETKVLSGYNAIHQQHSKPADEAATEQKATAAFAMPELVHNLQLLIDMCEEDIVQHERQVTHSKDIVVTLSHENTKLTGLLDQERKEIDRLSDLIGVIEGFESRSGDSSLEDYLTMFKRLQESYPEEYLLYELSSLAVAVVFPMIKQRLINWDPVLQPRYCLDVFTQWKDVLDGGTNSVLRYRGMSVREESVDVYQRLVWEVWMPAVRRCITNANIRDCDSLIEFLENWLPILPEWVFTNIRGQLIMPKLQQETENWNPLTDRVPVHSWIHPWLPLLGESLEPLYPVIRNKLASCLKEWYPTDRSAKLIIMPWKKVFSEGSLEVFLLKCIAPKLEVCLHDLVVNPHQQHLDLFTAVMDWEDLLPNEHMVKVFDKFFFPKWIQVLCSWLSSSPNFDEVTKWYTGWKTMFPNSMASHPRIKVHFMSALDIMDRAVACAPVNQHGTRENMAYFANKEKQKLSAATQDVKPVRVQDVKPSKAAASGSYPVDFKDLVERKAAEFNISFTMMPNRSKDGKQLYRFGRQIIYIEKGVIFAQLSDAFIPVSLQSIVDTEKT